MYTKTLKSYNYTVIKCNKGLLLSDHCIKDCEDMGKGIVQLVL